MWLQQFSKNLLYFLSFALVCILILHQPFIDHLTLFSPWHHDDFRILSWPMVPTIFTSRPASTNLLPFIGLLDEFNSYLVLIFLSILSFVLISSVAIIVSNCKLDQIELLIISIFICIIWFSLPGAAYQYQYLGMIPQLISLTFSALSILLGKYILENSKIKNVIYYLIFFIFCLVSFFSKEDCVLFVTLYFYYSFIISENKKVSLILLIISMVGLVLLLIHLQVVSNPFLLGSGAYELKNILRSILFGLQFYFFSQYSIILAFFTLISFFVFDTYRAIKNHSNFMDKWMNILGSSHALLLFLTAALILPYLILPRKFEFYSIGFQPFLISAAVITVFSEMRRLIIVPKLWFAGIGLFALLFAGMAYLDRNQIVAHLSWIKTLRSNTATQAAEIKHYGALDFPDCEKILVKGVDEISLFLAGDSGYVNELIGVDKNWIIMATPNTRMHVWAFESGRVFLPNWKYVALLKDVVDYDCEIGFDATTNRAVFSKP